MNEEERKEWNWDNRLRPHRLTGRIEFDTIKGVIKFDIYLDVDEDAVERRI